MVRWLRRQLRFLQQNISEKRLIDREISNDAAQATVRRIFWTAPVMAVGTSLAALGFWLQ
nr:hypothetical protein [Bacillota bacterium]